MQLALQKASQEASEARGQGLRAGWCARSEGQREQGHAHPETREKIPSLVHPKMDWPGGAEEHVNGCEEEMRKCKGK